MSVPLIVYGAGGLGREVMQMARLALNPDEYRLAGYADDGVAAGTILNGYPVLGGGEYVDSRRENFALVFGIADPVTKERLYLRYSKMPNVNFPNIIHPGASIHESASLGRGVVAAYGAFVSIDAELGDFVFLNNGVSIGHDARLGNFSSMMPLASISGWVKIGERCMIGTQCAIKQRVSIGDGATIGMGSVVTRDVPDGAVVLGNPARSAG
jgi:sugar O-acyltransferase (sialic acid O-acetyltransferase NeuD family)